MNTFAHAVANTNNRWNTLVDLLQFRAKASPGTNAFIFLKDGEDEEQSISYQQLDAEARAIAVHLLGHAPPTERALLLFQPGLEFISAFFGCLYAGMIAIPAYPPRNPRNVPRIQTIAADSQASFCLSSASVITRSQELFGIVPGLEKLLWIPTDQTPAALADRWTMPEIQPKSLAYLQYTSGSTSDPKGVMVSHGNLLHNLSFLCDGRNHTKIVSWLPFFHDMGLIYGMLQGIYGGFPSILLAPATFLQRPVRWLKAISKYQASTTIAPNFAYELCAEKVTEAEKKQLDLSSWTMALNAAEPVRADTLQRFASAFAGCGFKQEFLKPAYGLAEATLGVSIFAKNSRYIVKALDRSALLQGQVTPATAAADPYWAVGCGQHSADQQIAIVNPETNTRCQPNEIGEIWISGPSVAQGYWKRPDDTASVFRARLAGSEEGPFLRTGDLGFMADDELFITGRWKDLIIIRGSNHYPQDIEYTVQKTHPALQSDAGAAFSITSAAEEKLVVVQELVRHHKADLAQIADQVREAVAQAHGLHLAALLLVKPYAVPKTSSGKIRRREASRLFLEKQFEVEFEWHDTAPPSVTLPATEPASPAASTGLSGSSSDSQTAPSTPQPSLESWIIQRLAAYAKVPATDIRPGQTFASRGLDSLGALSLAGDLERKLGVRVPASLAYDYPVIRDAVRFLLGADQAQTAAPRAPEAHPSEPIAVIGLGCRFPGANNPQEFWKLLANGTDAITEIPADRWSAAEFYNPAPGTPGKMNTRWGGFINNVRAFDHPFFEISFREAAEMDPQQRILLQVAWQTFENAGVSIQQLAGSKTGVFVGISTFDYSLLILQDRSRINAYAGTGLAHSIAANRLSYFFDLRGPSMAIDTACSSSLVALHHACESLRRHESDLALAAGVNLILAPDLNITLSNALMMAGDGRCKTFDARADGYVRGEGCGAVLLKRLSDALRDGDTILSLVAGSAVNQDGHSNGLTAPNGPAQEAVIQKALQQAGLPPHAISSVECHGTGTALGDPQEVEALSHVLLQNRSPDQTCWLSSVKTNIGHLEAAAGIAAVCKVVLSLANRQIPPHLHFQKINPLIHLEKTPFKIPQQLVPWTSSETLHAGVSSFGFGGANAHAILSQAPPAGVSAAHGPHVVTLSAKSKASLEILAASVADFIQANPHLPIDDLSFSLNRGRTSLPARLAFPAATTQEIAEQLKSFTAGTAHPQFYRGCQFDREDREPPAIAFLFTGQGAEHSSMGRELFETEPLFRKCLEQCNEILMPHLDQPLLSILYSSRAEEPLLHETRFAQPALFAVEYALAELWKSWGILPQALLGHGIGEYVAACQAGVFDLEDALQLVATRARLLNSLPAHGQMAAILAGPEEIEPFLAPFSDSVSIAALNGPAMTVVSGLGPAINALLSTLENEGINHQKLPPSQAFHSPMVEPILNDFQKAASQISYRAPSVRLVSNLTGEIFPDGTVPDATYWTRHLRQPVQFAQGIQALLKMSCNCFLECGPNPSLLSMAKRCAPPGAGLSAVQWLPSIKKTKSNRASLTETLTTLWLSGAPVAWHRVHPAAARRMIWLPNYPFQTTECWFQPPEANRSAPNLTAPVPSSAHSAARVTLPELSWREWIQDLQAWSNDRLSTIAPEGHRFAILNRLSTAYILRGLDQAGLLGFTSAPTPSNRHPAHRLAARFEDVCRNWIQKFVKRGDLRLVGSQIVPTQPDLAQSITTLLETAQPLWSDQPYFLELVRACGENLAPILAGQTDPLAILFPNSSFSQVEKIYRDSVVAQFYNSLLAHSLRRLLENFPKSKTARILEAGAGTGATTSSLVPLLQEFPAEYTFTDIGSGFLQQAAKKFQAIPALQFAALDLEHPPAEQGFTLASYDVIIAANVFHATKNLRTTLRHVQSLLAPGGTLLLWEATEQQPWLDITFGLLPGWNLFEDRDLRPFHPLLSSREWTHLLLQSGFQSAAHFPSESDTALGQALIVARTSPSVVSADSTAVESTAGASSNRKELLYSVDWERVAPHPAQAQPTVGTWCIFTGQNQLAPGLIHAFHQINARPILIRPGTVFQHDAAETVSIDPANPAHFTEILQDLARKYGPLAGAVYLVGFDPVSTDPATHPNHVSAHEPLLHLARALSSAPSQSSPARLWIFTQSAQRAAAFTADSVKPDQALLWGFGRSFALENPALWGGLVDLPHQPAPADWNGALHALLQNAPEKELAIRGGAPYAPRLLPCSLPPAAEPLRFFSDATYLITGGLGGIAARLGSWLIGHGARRLLLLGRTQLPPRSAWRRHLADHGEYSSKIETILAFERAGASVHYAAADLADDQQIAEIFQTFENECWPPIRGLFHAAGTVADHLVTEMPVADWLKVLAPKVSGTLSLLRHLPASTLDFAVFFSSAASVFGSAGGSNYSAANAFLDALADQLGAAGTHALSISWGPWKEVGMAALASRTEALARRGVQPIEPESAFQALALCLQSRRSHAVVLKLAGGNPILSQNPPPPSLAVQGDLNSAARCVSEASGSRAGTQPASDPSPTRQSIISTLAQCAAELLRTPDPALLTPNQPLSSFGFDSIMAVQLKNEIELRFGTTLTLQEITHGSLDQLAAKTLLQL